MYNSAESSNLMFSFIFFFFLLICFGVLISWCVVSNDCTFDDKLLPGQKYSVGDRQYTVPKLPHKIWGSKQTATMDRPLPRLPEKVLTDLRSLIVDGFQTLRAANVPFWCTGGTLFSAVLWKHLMPFDDDVDVSVLWDDRAYLWSPEFAAIADLNGLEIITFRGASLSFATREGAAIRLRKKKTIFPVMDIFFTKCLTDQNKFIRGIPVGKH